MSEPIKTKYKHIRFEKGGNIWYCKNNKSDDILGWIEIYPKWKQWIFQSYSVSVYNIDCLADIIHFMNQLEKPK